MSSKFLACLVYANEEYSINYDEFDSFKTREEAENAISKHLITYIINEINEALENTKEQNRRETRSSSSTSSQNFQSDTSSSISSINYKLHYLDHFIKDQNNRVFDILPEFNNLNSINKIYEHFKSYSLSCLNKYDWLIKEKKEELKGTNKNILSKIEDFEAEECRLEEETNQHQDLMASSLRKLRPRTWFGLLFGGKADLLGQFDGFPTSTFEVPITVDEFFKNLSGCSRKGDMSSGKLNGRIDQVEDILKNMKKKFIINNKTNENITNMTDDSSQ